jgi:hypothetical protein
MGDIQEIEVVIKPDGTVEVKVRGVQGPACLAVTKEMERYLGGRVSHREHTAEYSHVAQSAQESDRLKLGE